MTDAHDDVGGTRLGALGRGATEPGGRGRKGRKFLSGLLVTAIAAAALSATTALTLASPTPAQALPGNPGVPSAGTPVYSENFQNVPGPSPIQRITQYTGTTGQTYTADQPWLENCNGWVAAEAQSPTAAAQVADCNGSSGGFGQTGWNGAQQQAYAIGVYNGQSPAQAVNNYAVSAYTQDNPGAPFVEFRTTSNIPFVASNRFITFGVDVAAANCFAAHPLLQFQLVNASGVATNAGSQIDACTDPGVTSITVPGFGAQGERTMNVGTFTSNGAVLFSGNSVGVRMINNQPSGGGNDHTFDNIKILDVTPQLDKSFSPAIATTGGTSTLTFTITNTSELAAKNGWSFTDNLPSGLTIANPSAATTTCSSGQVTAAAGGTSVAVTGNLDAGQASCTASVQVTSNTTGTYTNGPSNVTPNGLNPPGSATVVFQDPSLSIVKTAGTPTDVNGNGITDAGDTVPYSFVVTNTGDVPLTNVAVNDPKISNVSCPATTLAVSADMTCTATYTVTAADVTSGSVINTATASGTPPVGTPVTSPPSSTTTPLTAPAPALTLEKTASADTVDAAGDGVTYTFTVTNSGNVPVQNVAIDEGTFTGSGSLSDITCDATSLAVGESTDCTATYTATQADIDQGSIDNTATATGTPVGSTTPVTSNEDTATVTADQTPAISVVKSASPNTPQAYQVGQEVTYSFVVRNTGNTTLTDVTVNEEEFSGTGTLSAVTCPAGAASVAPGASVTCTATYTLTQADIDAGRVTNSATAEGTPPSGTPVDSPPSDAVVPVTPAPSLSIVKSANPTAVTAAGDSVTYSFVLTNTGNVTLTDVTVDEGAFTGTGDLSAIDCPAGAGSLVPGASVTCTATYELTQADVDAGSVTNTATGTGTPPGGGTVTTPPSTAIVTAEPDPSLTVVKTATPDTASAVGDEIEYSFLVTNTGNVTLTDVAIDEGEFSGTGELSAVTCPTTMLAPGASVTCTATYSLTQADVDAGTVTNTATAEGTPPGSDTPVTSPPSEAEVTVPQDPSLTVVKTSNVEQLTRAGQVITYSFRVTNTGNVTLSDVVVNEGDFTGTGELSAVTCPTTTLAAGDVVTCTATYTVTQADIDAGKITNAATATGTPPADNPPVDSPPSEVTVPATQTASISIVKSAAIAGEDYTIGAEVTYSFVATNTGNTTLTDVSIEETAFSGTGTLSAIDCPADQTASLAPGAQVTCTATYTLTQADIDAGEVTNTAVAHGTPPSTVPNGELTSTPSDAVVPTPQNASLSVVKTADVQTISKAGQKVTFSFVVTNTGNVTVTDPKVVDSGFSGTGELSAITCPTDSRTLLPGQAVTCTATYTVTQADVDSGALRNTATATGTTPGGDPTDPTPPSTVTVPTDPQPSLEVVKTADRDKVVGVGQTITYTFTVTNTGNVTIRDAKVEDRDFTGTGKLSAITCPSGIAALAPGAVVECTATYVTTPGDVTAGKVTNTAVASGTPVTGGDPVPSKPSTVTVSITPATAGTTGGGTLAFTGANVAVPIGIAIVLLLGGAVLFTITRRRRNQA